MVLEKIKKRLPNQWPITTLVGASLFYWLLLYGRLILESQPTHRKWFQFLAGVASILALLEYPYRYLFGNSSSESVSRLEIAVRGAGTVVISALVFGWIFDGNSFQSSAPIPFGEVGGLLSGVLLVMVLLVPLAVLNFILPKVRQVTADSATSEKEEQDESRGESSEDEPEATFGSLPAKDDSEDGEHEEQEEPSRIPTSVGLVQQDPPQNRCGYTPETDDFEGHLSPICCWRDVWRDTGRCVWHADVENKPVSVLQESRLDRPERLDGAIIRNTDLRDTISFKRCNLHAANFMGSDISGVILVNANLTNAELSKTNLNDASLSEANLTKAKLRDAKLTNASLINTDFTNSFLEGADLKHSYPQAADFTDAYLISADLTDASLQEAKLTDAYLRAANLTDASLYYALLENTYLSQANLTRTNLFGANLTAARLYGAVFDGTQISRSTTFGDHYQDDLENEAPTDDDSDDPTAWDKARWTDRQLERLAQDNALPERAREHFVTRKELRREEHRKLGNHLKWLKATASRWVMRYGEGPWNVVYTSLAFIGLFGLLYPLAGGIDKTPTGDGTTTHTLDWLPIPDLVGPLPDVLVTLLTSFYFSFVTFTTLGYGDIRPATGATQVLATVESFLGALLMALLVFVLGRRTTW